jgi:monoamine oxidase
MIVVGGGIAGLFIASELSKKGPVTLIEKENHLGGRIEGGAVGSDHFEIGAGRLHSNHKRLLALIKSFGLKTIDIGSSSMWRPLGSQSMPNLFEPTWMALLSQFRKLSPSILGTTTLKDLTVDVLGFDEATRLLDTFPYRTELESMRADLAIRAFDEIDGGQFMVVAGGLTQIVDGLAAIIRKNGGKILLSTKVINVTDTGVKTRDGFIEGSKVILCLTSEALKKLPVTKGLKVLDHLGMAPLIRIYAKYSPWFTEQDRTVTNSPLRYIIPIRPDKGVIMISYTDGRDTHRWADLHGPLLIQMIQQEVRALFPERIIPEPEWMKSYHWKEGTTYWKPGDYDPEEESRLVLQPRKSTLPGLFICGESFSLQQAWIEGSLAHAEMLLSLLKDL